MKSWGKCCSVDLWGCDKEILLDKKKIREFNKILCDGIDMKRVGRCSVKKFGEGVLEGISSMQFIETSSIVVHADDKGNRAFIDLFSCKDFDDKEVRNFCKDYFKAKKGKSRIFLRG